MSDDARIAVHGTRLDRLEADLNEIKGDIRAIRDFMIQTKGGWRALAAAGVIGGGISAAITKILPFLTTK